MRKYEKYWACGVRREEPFDRSQVRPPTKYWMNGRYVTLDEVKASGVEVDDEGMCVWWDHSSFRSYSDWDILEEPYKRVKMQCPLCGRRVVARVVALHDGIRGFSLPRHKPKG